MKVSFTRSGGFAGLISQAHLDLDQLAPTERDEIEALVAAAGFFELPIALTAPHPDALHYSIAVEHEGRRHTVEVDERAAPKTLRPLIERLSRLTRAAGQGSQCG